MTHVNDSSVDDQPNIPFGGEKNSGIGRYGGEWVIDAIRSSMRAARVPSPTEPRLELVELETPEPRAGTVRIRVEACGICHSDSITVNKAFPGIQYPRGAGS